MKIVIAITICGLVCAIIGYCTALGIEAVRKRKPSLRDQCAKAYGEEFGELYDKSCRGEPIGDTAETIQFLEMIEKIRNTKQ